jgi:hypothetical protein
MIKARAAGGMDRDQRMKRMEALLEGLICRRCISGGFSAIKKESVEVKEAKVDAV